MKRRPNVLLIWTDQQRADTFTCHGGDYIQAPHLNRLAEESFVFEHAYCAQPVCTPSRGSILTGLWPHAHGSTSNNVPLNSDVPTIAEHLGDSYRTAYFGKWHLGDELRAQGRFGERVSTEDGYGDFYAREEDRHKRSHYHHFLVENGFVPDGKSDEGGEMFRRKYAAVMAERYTKAHFLGEQASAYLREYREQNPFFLSVNFLEPHSPYFGPLNYLHDPAALPVGPAFGVQPGPDASLYARVIAEQKQERSFAGDETRLRRLRANYYGLVTLVDRAVGAILQALEESGQADNTLVVFTSDHGEMLGDHGIIGKTVLYEPSVRIPLMMRVPWLGRQHRMLEGRVSQVDLLPTILDLVGSDEVAPVQGESRADVVRGDADLRENDVFVEWNPARGKAKGKVKEIPGFTREEVEIATSPEQVWRSIVSHDGWKLNLCAVDQCELYDLNSDPHEMKNVFHEPRNQDRVTALTQRIQAWQTQTNDTAPL